MDPHKEIRMGRACRALFVLTFFSLIEYPAKMLAMPVSGNGAFPHFSVNSDDSTTDATQASSSAARPFGVISKPLTGGEKATYYLRFTYGPQSVALSLAGAGINQARDNVPEWGQGIEGYGKRLSSSFGHKAVKCSIQLGIGAFLHEDPRYFASARSGIWQRTIYAVGQTFVSHKDFGGIRPGYSRLIGIVGGAYISRQWHPASDRTAGRYISASAISMGLDIAKSVFAEFWPDLKKLLHR